MVENNALRETNKGLTEKAIKESKFRMKTPQTSQTPIFPLIPPQSSFSMQSQVNGFNFHFEKIKEPLYNFHLRCGELELDSNS
jgi:hypothetical protein